MTDWIGVPTLIGQAKIAAALGGTPLALSTVRVGDGNGAVITPLETMTALVRQVASYPVAESARDAVNTNMWRVTASLPLADGPYTIREIAVFDASGDMIAIAQHPVVEKLPGVNDGVIGIIFAVGAAANLAVTINPAAQVSLAQMLRAGWITVDGELTTPPAAPPLGATYLVGAGAAGAWAGQTGKLTQWTGLVWSFASAPVGHMICDNSKTDAHASRLQRRTTTGWTSALLSSDAAGFASAAQLRAQGWNWLAAGGTASAIELTPAPAFGSLAEAVGVPLRFVAPGASLGVPTIKLGTLPTRPSAGAPWRLNDIVEAIFDGSNFRHSVFGPQRTASAFRLRTSANQAVPQSSTAQILAWAVVDATIVDTVIGADDVVIGEQDAGWWQFSAKAMYDFPSAGDMNTNILIERVSSGVVHEEGAGNARGTTTIRARPQATAIVKCSVGDIVRVRTTTDVARNLVGGATEHSLFQGMKVGS